MPEEMLATQANEEVTEKPDADLVPDERSEPQVELDVENKPAAEAAAEEYTPNYKYKALDQEKEFEDWVKPYLTKDTEEKFRDLFSMKDAAEFMKAKREEERLAKEEIFGKYGELESTIKDVMSLKDYDLGMFFDRLQLPRAQVAKWLLQQLETQELPPEQQKTYTELDTLKRKVYELERNNQGIASTYETQLVQARTTDLNNVLNSPEVQPLVQQFDSRLGKPGAFRDMVVRHGRAEWDISGGKRDLSAGEAVKEVLTILGMQSQVASQATKPNETPAEPKIVKEKKPTVLPNLGGGGASPAGKQPKNLDDLRALAREAQVS